MADIIIVRDDLITYLESEGISTLIESLADLNTPIADFLCEVKVWGRNKGISLAGMDAYQVERLIADLDGAGKLANATLIEGSNVVAVSRAAAPSGIGIGSGNVWVTPPEGSYVLRFYVNGVLKTTLTDYYITDLATIGAVSGDTVQVCRVVDGIPGWWARIAVS